jgi:ankyrin repeat protein
MEGMKMRKILLPLLVVFLFSLNRAPASAISWGDKEVVDPINGVTITVQEPLSWGSYIYHWPSKYDGVYWPHVDENWIWFSPSSGYTSFGNDFAELDEEEKARVGEYLRENYTQRGTPISTKDRLTLLEEIYRLRKKDDAFWSWFYRVMAAWNQGAAATEYRRKALPLLESRLTILEPGFERIQHLYLVGEYSRQFGSIDKAKECFFEARTTAWQENDEEQVGHDYIAGIIKQVDALLLPALPSSDWYRMIHAIEEGGIAEVKALLAGGVRPNETLLSGWTPLMWAALQGQMEILDLLLEAGGDIKARSADGRTSLMYAAWRGETDSMRALLESGADVEAQDTKGNTSLLIAANRGHSEAVAVLLQEGADVNAENQAGFDPLLYCAKIGYIDLLKSLMSAGADIGKKDILGRNALMFAAANGYGEIAAAVIEEDGDVNATDNYGYTALMYAAYFDKVEMLELLMDSGAKVAARNKDGQSALDMADSAGSEEAYKLLLERTPK